MLAPQVADAGRLDPDAQGAGERMGLRVGGGQAPQIRVLQFLNDKVGFFVEPYGAFVEFEEPVTNANFGMTYLLNPLVQLDFSFGTGLDNTMNFFGAGISFRIDGN